MAGSGGSGRRGRRLDSVQLGRLLGGHETDPDQVERADEPVAHPEPAGAEYGVAQPDRPVVLEQDERRRRAVGDVLEDVPGVGVGEGGDAVSRRLGTGQCADLRAFLSVEAQADECPDDTAGSVASSSVRLLRCIAAISPSGSL